MDSDMSVTMGKKEKDVYIKVFDMKNQIYVQGRASLSDGNVGD